MQYYYNNNKNNRMKKNKPHENHSHIGYAYQYHVNKKGKTWWYINAFKSQQVAAVINKYAKTPLHRYLLWM